jgi:hypothetical protein
MMPADHHYAELWLSLVPHEVRKSITAAELNDRIIEAGRLSKKASDLTLRKEDREEARARAQQVMRAAPRSETERLVAAKVVKAAQLGNSPQADMLRRQAQDLLDQNPPAPRRDAAVRKAEADKEEMLVPVFDEAGTLIGICDAEDITPLDGQQTGTPPPPAEDPAAAPAQPPAQAGQPVAKRSGLQVVVQDQRGRQYRVDRRNIRESAVRKAGDGGRITYRDRGDGKADVLDATGRLIGTISPQGGFVQQGYAGEQQILNPAAQARNTGPVRAGGTTGMGQPRTTGPAAALPADGPQAGLRGDVPGRTVVKASSLGLPYRTVGEAARERRLARIEKAAGQDLSRPHVYARNPYSPEAHCICEAPSGHGVHPYAAPRVRQVAKSTSWAPGLMNRATDQWLAAQRRGNPWPPVSGAR